MGEQRPAIITNEVEDDLLDRPPAEIIVHLHPADDLTAEDPDVVAVLAQGAAMRLISLLKSLPALSRFRVRARAALRTKPDHRDLRAAAPRFATGVLGLS